MSSLFLVPFLAGLVIAGISVPMVLDKVPPNHLYGFRTKKTLSSKEIWYKSNRRAGKEFLGAGLFISIIFLILMTLLFVFHVPFPGYVLAILNPALVILPVLIAMLRSFLYLRRL